MSNMIMASSSKTLITSTSLLQSTNTCSTTTPKPPPQKISSIIKMQINNNIPSSSSKKTTHKKFSSILLSLDTLKSTAAIAAAALAMAPESLAEQTRKAALFEFNLTLPIIMGEFLFLMVVLDKIYYTPLGNFMDARDAEIREKLNSVKDTSAEVKQLEEQARAVMRAARAEIAAALNQMKKETEAEVEAKMAEGMKKVEAELAEALANLEKQKVETIKALDSQIAQLSQDIVNKVIPMPRTEGGGRRKSNNVKAKTAAVMKMGANVFLLVFAGFLIFLFSSVPQVATAVSSADQTTKDHVVSSSTDDNEMSSSQ